MTTDEEILNKVGIHWGMGGVRGNMVREAMKLAREDERKEALADCADSHDDMLEEKEKEIQTLLAKQKKLENALSECQDILQEVLNQACWDGRNETDTENKADSSALSAYARGLRYMSKVGRFKIENEVGRRVLGEWRAEGERINQNKKALQEVDR